ncbi:MAG: hypothetical protein ACTSU6_01900 [Candidatus Njordarchaeales archaeon]
MNTRMAIYLLENNIFYMKKWLPRFLLIAALFYVAGQVDLIDVYNNYGLDYDFEKAIPLFISIEFIGLYLWYLWDKRKTK